MASDEMPRFTLGSYLASKLAGIAIAALALAFTCLVLFITGTPFDAIVLVLSVLVAAGVLVLAFDFARRRRFWRALVDTISALDKARYFEDLSFDPSFCEGRITQELLASMMQRAEAETSEAKARHLAMREYNELWTHEIKTPLAAAKLLAAKLHGPDSQALRLELERIEGLVTQALFAARADSLENDYLIREVALADCVAEACKQNMLYLTSRDITLDIAVAESVRVYADKAWLAFILSQLIINAAKYDAKTIRFRVMPAPEEGAHACTIFEVADDGCGIPAADVPRVFDRGFTGEVGRAHGSATGMGLFLVARMCAQMGLGIMIASEEGAGTRVEISFPHDRRRASFTKGV